MAGRKSGNRLWLLGAAAVYGLCFAANLAGAWWEYGPATVWNLLVSLVYLTFWGAFTLCARAHRGRLRVARTMAGLTLVGAAAALVARTPGVWLLTLPALALTPLTAVPMYGLRMLLDWDMTYLVTALLAGVWLLGAGWMRE